MIIAARMKRIKIDHIIFADTGNEKPETYQFLEFFDNWLQQPWQDYPYYPGITIVRNEISKVGKREQTKREFKFIGKSSFIAAPWFVFEQYLKQTYIPENLGEACLIKETMPSKAYGYGACSAKWKIEPTDKYLRALKLNGVVRWLGIHAEETRRLLNKNGEAKDLKDKLGFIDYPLIKWGLNQQNCEALCLVALGFVPVKSACWFCPHSKPTEILQLKEKYPEFYEMACFMEEQASRHLNPSSSVKGLGRHFKWRDIGAISEAKRIQLELFASTKKCSCTD